MNATAPTHDNPYANSPFRTPSLDLLAARARGIVNRPRPAELPNALQDYNAVLELRLALSNSFARRGDVSNRAEPHPRSNQRALDNLQAIAKAAGRISPAAAQRHLAPVTNETLRTLSRIANEADQIDPAATHGDHVAAIYARHSDAIAGTYEILATPGKLDKLRQSAHNARMSEQLKAHSDNSWQQRKGKFANALAGIASPPSVRNETEAALMLLGILFRSVGSPLQSTYALGSAARDPLATGFMRLSRYAAGRFAGAIAGERAPWIARAAGVAGPPSAKATALERVRLADSDHINPTEDPTNTITQSRNALSRAARDFGQAMLDAPDHLHHRLPRNVRNWITGKGSMPGLASVSTFLLGNRPRPGHRAARALRRADIPEDSRTAAETAIAMDPGAQRKWQQWQSENTEQTRLEDPRWVHETIRSMPDDLQERIAADHPAATAGETALKAAANPAWRSAIAERHRLETSAALLSHAAEAMRSASATETIDIRFASAAARLAETDTGDLARMRRSTSPVAIANRKLINDIQHFATPLRDTDDPRAQLQSRWEQLPEERKKHFASLELHATEHGAAPLQPPAAATDWALDLSDPGQMRWALALSDYIGTASRQLAQKPSSPLDRLAGMHALRIHSYKPHERHVPTEPAKPEPKPAAPGRGR